ISTVLPASVTCALSITAVPPEVTSRSNVALSVLDFSVSQCPANDFSCSKAAVPFPPAFAGAIAKANTAVVTAAKIFVPVLTFMTPSSLLDRPTTRNFVVQDSSRDAPCFRLLSEFLCRKSDHDTEQHSGQH